jgi:hypothetical protein
MLSHLGLGCILVVSYDSQGLKWKYSNPPVWEAIPFIAQRMNETAIDTDNRYDDKGPRSAIYFCKSKLSTSNKFPMYKAILKPTWI